MARVQGIFCIAILLLLQSSQVLCHNKTHSNSNNCPPCQCQCNDNHHEQGHDNHHEQGHDNHSAQGHDNQSTPPQGHDDHQESATMVSSFMRWIQFMGSLGHSTFPIAFNRFDPVYTIVVDQNDGVGEFTSIQEAIDSVALINFQRVVIKINAGIYTEKISISPLRAFITLQGEGADSTIIQWGADAHVGLGAFASATLAVNAPNFIAKNITFKNSASVTAVGVGVAVRVSADTATFLGCKFLSSHNTLYDHVGRHYYKDCYIEGGVDFVFGQALSLFEGCFLKATAEANGAVSLERGVSLLDNMGLSFSNCRLAGASVFYLGRAWGTFSRVVLANSFLDHVEVPKGLKLSASAQSHLNVFFGVHKCYGPGVDFALKSSWATELTVEQVKPFNSLKFIDGQEWIKC